MKSSLIKKCGAVLCSLAIVISAVFVSGLNAFAAETDPVPQSDWEMTVPQIYITTENGNGTTLEKEDGYQNASVQILGTDGSVLSDACTFKVRGNTTALSWITKKAFTFKFAKKKDVLGMGKGKKWALIANAFDPTLLRNYTAFELADELGLAYTSKRQFVELWVDGSFRGCYMLFEPVQAGSDRVDIDIESNGGKKDFLIEYEASRVEEDVTYFTVDGLRFIASEPEEPDDEQLAYIKGAMQDVITTIRNGSREEIESKVDIPSFAKFYVLNEYMKTYDFNMSSVFFYYKDGKLYAGPPWDYDMSLGNETASFSSVAAESADPTGVFAANKNIYKYLCKHAWFNEQARRVYHQHFDFITSIAADGGLLDTAREQYGDIIARNYSTAGWYVGRWWINYQLKPQTSYNGNFNVLKSWAQERSGWMQDYYGLPSAPFVLGDADGNGRININDVTTIQRLLAEQPLDDSEAVALRGDANADGRLTVEDATIIQRRIADYPTRYLIGETTVA